MNQDLPARQTAEVSNLPARADVWAGPEPSPERIWAERLLYGIRSLLLGMLFVLSVPGALAFLGWVMRCTQREVLRTWWKHAVHEGRSHAWEPFALGDQWTRDHVKRPRWFLATRRREAGGPWARIRETARWLFGSLVNNLKVGIQALFNVWVLTIPGCLLWLFAWYDGWNNSFNKGYEQAMVGPLTGILGVFLFMGAMLYVPLAQARQAASGDWRCFYDFKLVWKISRREWISCLGLAALYSILTLPVMILKTVPGFLTQMRPDWESRSPAEAASWLQGYWFWSAMVLVPAYFLLRMAAARIYARGILRGVRRGAIAEEDLAPQEWTALHRLGLLTSGSTPEPAWWIRALAWVGTRVGSAAALALSLFLGFTLVAQIFISEFFVYHPFVGWMNQPTIQLPYWGYRGAEIIDSEIQNEARGDAATHETRDAGQPGD